MLVYSHADCALHQPGAGHPEAAFRLEAVLQAVEGLALPILPAQEATAAQLYAAHSREWIDQLLALSDTQTPVRIDADTVCGPGSVRAARLAAGAVVQAVDSVLAAPNVQQRAAFCAVRPPGHHATRAQAMGFCLINSIAVGAYHALSRGLQRVSIVDFDVHHGNGTQDIFYQDARVQYLSSHQAPLYPGTGKASERGKFGQVHNVGLASGAGSAAFRALYQNQLLPALRAFQPELILISAGFDAHHLDPLAGLSLEAEDYYWLSRELRQIAAECAQSRLVSVLEGGYSATALSECTRAHLLGLNFDEEIHEHATGRR